MDEGICTVWWVRHGPTHAKGMVGWTDLSADLSDGQAISRLATALPAEAPIVSSDLSRTIQTADAIAQDRTRLPANAALREMHFGEWEMRTHADLETENRELIAAFWERPDQVRPPGGETLADVSIRVGPAIDHLLGQHSQLIAVAHFGVILSELCRVAGWSVEQALSQRIDPLSVTQIDYGPQARAGMVNWRP